MCGPDGAGSPFAIPTPAGDATLASKPNTRDPLPFPPLTRKRCLVRAARIMRSLPDHSLTPAQREREALASAYYAASKGARR